jgi:hypothetical protein
MSNVWSTYMLSIKSSFIKKWDWLGDWLPIERIYYMLLVVYLSVATNDIQIPQGSFLKQNYLAHIMIVFILSYFSLAVGDKAHFISRFTSAVIVTFVFYFITRPKKYDIFDKTFYFQTADISIPKAT